MNYLTGMRSRYLKQLFTVMIIMMIITALANLAVSSLSFITAIVSVFLLHAYWKLWKYSQNRKSFWAFWVTIIAFILAVIFISILFSRIFQAIPKYLLYSNNVEEIAIFIENFLANDPSLLIITAFTILVIVLVPRFLITSFIGDEIKDETVTKYTRILLIALPSMFVLTVLSILFPGSIHVYVYMLLSLAIDAFYTYYLYLAYQASMAMDEDEFNAFRESTKHNIDNDRF